ncbi:efflux transporter outer membrane subunit [Acetobacter peroxydans]|uniref:efflux transporter outer membrane subunit n=1 Tax=Acetobacter peroxydans TaxID=104098 RepID=UPI0023538529|nr:efflux transporter outer membrane subunit [Acetobacter peroxydans]MCH4143337.1 efflux transporter outer membrane subunit [Acetobacter peroxydans]MCI1411865.1 efflux transporter outer membrane subunit [Acetobacter peroxydans]MCI1440194.1 efflux transporter outer membrane subunit [Acetobacter peroxydans]MCI1567200.1 efflux transporter outer membrane subunit [Acetobacter peroxydans]MCI1725014.1 efflux transporter outer membrane subunit [Acetobacter peroxydans]
MAKTQVAKRQAQTTSTLVLAVLLAGCAVGPDFKKPESWTPEQWRQAATQERSRLLSVPTTEEPPAAWWSIFHDPELTALEERLASQNLDVQQASEQLAVSRGQLLLAGAERFPDLAATGSYQRVQYSTKEMQWVLKRVGRQAGGLSDQIEAAASSASVPLLNEWQDGLQSSWEVDLWGRVRRQYEAAKAYMTASQEERRGILVARQAELASDYITLRQLQEQARITRASRDLAAALTSLSESRYRSGLVSELDVDSAQAELQRTNALLPQYDQRIAMQINAINLLMGAPPGTLDAELGRHAAIPLVPPAAPVGVPSELARRRPDIREAEARLHGATAEVGQAVADFYPKVTIDAGFGFQSLSFRDLGFWNARAWNVGPSISLPIFQGGRLSGQLEMKKASQRAEALNYRKTVLNAWREVDNALVAWQAEQRRNQAITAQVQSDSRALALAQDQYRHGLQNYLQVLDAQRRLLQSQTQEAESTATLSGNLVQLYNALGGGWEPSFPEAKPKK